MKENPKSNPKSKQIQKQFVRAEPSSWNWKFENENCTTRVP